MDPNYFQGEALKGTPHAPFQEKDKYYKCMYT